MADKDISKVVRLDTVEKRLDSVEKFLGWTLRIVAGALIVFFSREIAKG